MIPGKKRIRIHNFLVAACAGFILSSCEKKEPLYHLNIEPGQALVSTAGMGENYDKQVWFELSTSASSVNDPGNWDLAFNAGSTNNAVYLNDYNNSHIYNTGTTDVTVPIVPSQIKDWRYDNPNGRWDSTGAGKWCDYSGGKLISRGNVYLVDRGEAATGGLRYFKLVLLNRDTKGYSIAVGLPSDTVLKEVTIETVSARNFLYYQFQRGQVDNEIRASEQWDLLFRKYRDYALNTATNEWEPYMVTGVLLNPGKVLALQETSRAFRDIDLAYARSLKLSSNRNAIGYLWKTFDQTAGKYTVDTKKTYIIQDNKGSLYKLRFLDFYNDQNLKGYPKFEFQRL